MKKFLAKSDSGTIEAVEVLKESETGVYIPNHWYPSGQRYDKISATRGYFDAVPEAKAFLVEIEERKIAALTRELARRQDRIAKIQELKE